MTTHYCSCCKQDKPREEFVNSRNTEDGVSVQCKPCMRENSRKARERNPNLNKQTYAKHREKYLARYKEIRDARPDVQASRAERLDLRNTYSQPASDQAEKVFNSMKGLLLAPVKAVERVQRKEARRRRKLAYKAQRLANNPGMGHERRAKKTKWSNWADFAPFYVEARLLTLATGVQWDVEHIYPLRADWVCGLHTPANLRVMPHRMNRAKDVKVDIRVWPETWLDESMVFDPNNHPDGWLECFATTSGEKHIGITASDLLHDLDEALAHDMVHRLAD
jgi:hypothetical protein